MAQDTAPNVHDTRAAQTPSATGAATGYMSGFGNSFETEALPGARVAPSCKFSGRWFSGGRGSPPPLWWLSIVSPGV